ncbi:MAG: hypothetical protein ABIL45_07085 [candidate division WOR-3 bacterium]|jgi:hypothetical protein
MVYLCIKAKEFGQFEITQKNRDIIKDVIKAFAIASQQHKADIYAKLKYL